MLNSAQNVIASSSTLPVSSNFVGWQKAVIAGLPAISVILVILVFYLLRRFRPSKDFPSQIPKDVIQPGQVAGDYSANWKNSFEMVFLIGWMVALVILIAVTILRDPELFWCHELWSYSLPKFFAMSAFAALGGWVCRHFCTTDNKGYIITNPNSVFKVNYTRKLQHFGAYLISLLLRINPEFRHPHEIGHLLGHVWGDMFILLAFLLMIKPIRERHKFFMLEFNSLDRPEDRPNTLKWIIAGNLVPGMTLNRIFEWAFGLTGHAALIFVIVLIIGIGDGLAEPVGIFLGKHKYKVLSWFSSRKYTRSWEGSMCVFLCSLILPALMFSSFSNFNQCLAAMIILSPVMTLAEATAPHSMDTPALMIIGYSILYSIIHLL